jgi:hypothetical protein
LALPFGLNQMKRILPTSGCHKPVIIVESDWSDNVRIADQALWGAIASPLLIEGKRGGRFRFLRGAGCGP